METIDIKEIKDLYKKCGLYNNQCYAIRTDLNIGTLENKLNTNFHFMNKEEQSFYSNNTITKGKF